METRATEKGCIFVEYGGQTCRKLVETGTLMCPHHNLLTEHREQEKVKREAEAKKRVVRNGRRT